MGIAKRVKTAIGQTTPIHNHFITRYEFALPLLSASSSMASASSHRPILRRYQTVAGHGAASAANPGKKHQVQGVAYCVKTEGPSRPAHQRLAVLSAKKRRANASPRAHIAAPIRPVGSGSGTCASSYLCSAPRILGGASLRKTAKTTGRKR